MAKKQSSPIAKQDQPMKTPALTGNGLPQQIKAPNAIASLPKAQGYISKPAPMAPRAPRLN